MCERRVNTPWPGAGRATLRRMLLSTRSNHPTSHCRENTFTAWHHWVAKLPPFQLLNQIVVVTVLLYTKHNQAEVQVALHISWLWIRLWLSPNPPKKFCNWLYKNGFCSIWQNHNLLGQLIFQYYILFWFILRIRHTIHRFGFTGLKIFQLLLNNFHLYLQNLVIPSMTRLDTLVNGVLIVHWPLAGKIHRERGLQNRHGWARRSILVLFQS